MREKWVIPIALAVLGGIGYLYWKDRQNASSPGSASSGSIAAGGNLSVVQPGPLATNSLGSYVDPTGGLNYVDAVPVSITSGTGFTPSDYNYGAVNEAPVAKLSNGYDLVTNPNGSGFTEVPRGLASLKSYESVVG